MTLQDFIKQEGASEIARMLRVSRAIVYLWRDGRAVPNIEKAFRLIVLSQYRLNLDKIYGSYLQARYGGKKFKAVLRNREVNLEFKF